MNINERILKIKNSIHQEEISCHRKAGGVRVVAVSKNQSIDAIKQVFALGIDDFGESYWQEAERKIKALANLPLCWHFIGPIQSNKTQGIAQRFSWVHSVCRLKIAKRLHEYRPDNLPPLQICLQINFDKMSPKSGVSPEKAGELIPEILSFSRLQLRGLMMIPEPQTNEQQQFASFIKLSQLLCTLNRQFDIHMDTLSMGMSNDFKAAIRAGSTMVRIGQAIFGERV